MCVPDPRKPGEQQEFEEGGGDGPEVLLRACHRVSRLVPSEPTGMNLESEKGHPMGTAFTIWHYLKHLEEFRCDRAARAVPPSGLGHLQG